ncbi:hypothetical protein BJ912DRAFT_960967, partial [Pholiota molesta]
PHFVRRVCIRNRGLHREVIRQFLAHFSLGSALAADIIIATSLCVSLSRSRTGFKKTDSIVTILMLYAINSICSAACLITYAIWPHEFTFIGIYVCLSKRDMLNGRKSLKRRVNGVSDSPFPFSNASGRPAEFVTSYMSKDAYAWNHHPRVSTEVETRHTAV